MRDEYEVRLGRLARPIGAIVAGLTAIYCVLSIRLMGAEARRKHAEEALEIEQAKTMIARQYHLDRRKIQVQKMIKTPAR